MGKIAEIINHYREKINEKWCEYANGEIEQEEYECYVMKMEHKRDNEILELVKGCKPEFEQLNGDESDIDTIKAISYNMAINRFLQNLSNLAKGESCEPTS